MGEKGQVRKDKEKYIHKQTLVKAVIELVSFHSLKKSIVLILFAQYFMPIYCNLSHYCEDNNIQCYKYFYFSGLI